MKKCGSGLSARLSLILQSFAVALTISLALPGVVLAGAASGQSLSDAPSGLAFYTPPSPLPPGRHGDLIWARRLDDGAALPHAGHNWRLLYRSTAIDGQPAPTTCSRGATTRLPR